MTPAEIRQIRGALTRIEFGRLLGVTALTVLRWELPEDNKEARRPRAKMVDALRRLAAGRSRHGSAEDFSEREGAEEDDASEPAIKGGAASEPSSAQRPSLPEERLLQPVLDRLCSEQWRRAEDELTALLTAGTLLTKLGRTLATLGLVQVQVMAHMDLRGALAVLVPILDEAARDELPAEIAGRAHVMATLVFAAPDSRVHDLGRVNSHAARAEQLLPHDADDLRILSATSCIAAARYLGPEVTLHAYKLHLKYLERARSALSRTLADALAGLVATIGNDLESSAQLGGRALEAAERMGHWGLVMGILSDYAHRVLRESQSPQAVLEIARRGREGALAARLVPTEGFIRLLGAECEALCRLARFDEAHGVAQEALGLAERAGLARYSLTAALSRLYVLTERLPELRALATYYEQESVGAQQAATRIQASYVQGVLASLAGDFAAAIERFDVVTGASDATAGLEYIVHSAHFELTTARALAGDLDGAQLALRRFNELLELRPSVWHATLARRAEALLLIIRGQLAEARLRIESAIATFSLLGDVAQAASEENSLALIAVAAGAPNATTLRTATAERVAQLGMSTSWLERWQHALSGPREGSWREQSMAEKLVVAAERLHVRGLDPAAFSRELAAVLELLFPGRTVLMGGTELGAVETTVEVSTDGSGAWRFGVQGSLDREQRAFLTLLASIVLGRPVPKPTAVESELVVDSILPEFIAVAPVTRQLKNDILRLSRSRATILVTGESGSGKEVVARAVHDVSPRAQKPYITLNCASVPRELFEGQLFGYRKGAFTGAVADNPGVIRAADTGTLFLDEIGELPLELQPKLLRFLENGEVLPIGEVKPKRVDVRIVAATHRDLARLAGEGRFREDLFYRLNVVPLRVPPLRQRPEDVIALARLFITRLCAPVDAAPQLGRSAISALRAHSWPGNVRELRNVIERAMAYSPVPAELQAAHLQIG